MRTLTSVPALLLLLSTAAGAQERPGVEIGTRIGFSAVDGDGHAFAAGAPGGGPSAAGVLLGGGASVHVATFPGEKVMSEAQLGGHYFSASGAETVRIGMISFMGAYVFLGPHQSSPYVGLNGTYAILDGDASDRTQDIAFGATAGVRVPVKEDVVIRVETAYRRWIDRHVREFNFAVTLGFLP